MTKEELKITGDNLIGIVRLTDEDDTMAHILSAHAGIQADIAYQLTRIADTLENVGNKGTGYIRTCDIGGSND